MRRPRGTLVAARGQAWPWSSDGTSELTGSSCPFCAIPDERTVADSRFSVAIPDAYPVSPGHTLIVPRRHICSLFSLPREEREDLMDLLETMAERLRQERSPDGFNIGVNEGGAAGQTITHLHVHLIPRYAGDVPDPRGGIRWIMPARADYWSEP